MKRFDHAAIEKKWREVWEKNRAYIVDQNVSPRRKAYILDMFPYPSGAGLHAGHVEGYTATDIYSRYLRMKSFDVLHPMGWDAFGLPAENYAIKTGIHPQVTTDKAIETFRNQMKNMGFSYDWSREIGTHIPEYYRWTQWLFIYLYKKGLAYRATASVNWCPSCKTVLANEQVVEGVCERCETEVEQKDMEQWFFKITAYADRLLADLETLDWPQSTKKGQINWIGKSKGASIQFSIHKSQDTLVIYTTKPETILGATYLAIAPEHPLISSLITNEYKVKARAYCSSAHKKTARERSSSKEKTGVFTGSYVVHPVTQEKLPIWISDYVVMSYGTGAVMGVPALDLRDEHFATKMKIPVRETDVVAGKKAYETLLKQGIATKQTRYKIRDWLVSRQRLWGAPIPMVFCERDGWQHVAETALPVRLPNDVDFKPTGESPLVHSLTFQKDAVCPVCGAKARRECDTIDTFVDSSWYYFRFVDPHNVNVFADSKKIQDWLPVDLYVGGAEHTVLHLLYARFITKVLYDDGLVPFSEPFLKLRHQGIILASDHRKMSKRWGNVVNPDDEISRFGADTVRMYEMFMGPLKDMKAWNTQGERGVYRFLQRVWLSQELVSNQESPEQEEIVSKLISSVTHDIERLEFNTCVSSFMQTLNTLQKFTFINKKVWENYLVLLAPFAPFVTEGLWNRDHKDSIHVQTYPEMRPRISVQKHAETPVIINNKVRAVITLGLDESQEIAVEKAVSDPRIIPHIKGEKIVRVVYVQGKVLKLIVA